MAQKLFLIDGYAQIFRCYYAPFQPLTAPDGEPTKATYVFSNMLLQLIREQKPDYLAMALDTSDETVFRREIDPAYKANREPPPEDLIPQIDRVIEIVETQEIPILRVPGFEADDLIATVCERLAGEDLEIAIVSKDKDLEQLLSERVRLFDPGKGEYIGPEELREKKGYGPEAAIEIQTLTGDTTDNVPGVKGVGPKKALDLINKYGSAQAVIAHADELTPAMSKNVKAFAPSIDVTRQLVTLRRDVPFDFDIEACAWKGVKAERLHPLFDKLGFRRLTEQMGDLARTGENGPAAEFVKDEVEGRERSPGAARVYTLVDTPEKLATFVDALKKPASFAFDTETTSLNAAHATLVGLSFSWRAGTGYYLPLQGVGPCLDTAATLDALRPILEDPSIRKVGQNLKYDLVVLKHHGIEVRGVEFDTMIASFVLDSSRRSHGMDALSREVLGIDPIPISELIGKGKNQIGFDQVDTQRACEYAAEDADITWQLGEVFRKQLEGSELEALFRETEMPLVQVLADMEAEGVKIDVDFLKKMSGELATQLEELRHRIHDEAGYPFNIDSTKQLAEVLFDHLGLPVIRKTKTGRSTDAETLDALAAQTDHPVPALIKQYRELTKLKGTYIDTLPTMSCARTGRVHASFHQTVAVTGRLSSSDPNLQNIPVRTEIGRQIRRAFVPRDAEHVLLTADYSQIELRVLAHLSKDEALRTAFAEDRDIHQFVAGQVFGVPLEEVTREQRGRAKAVNFGIVYGQTAYGLARGTGMPVGEAQAFIDMYFMRYPGIRMFIDATVAEAKKRGYVKTMLGRRRAVPDINSRNRNARQLAERVAVNTVVQGSAADMIKRAMINIHRRIRDENHPSRLLIQVHDELVFDVPRADVETEAAFIREEMVSAIPLEVPVKVDLAWAENWLESK